jgi:hypothetical protein
MTKTLRCVVCARALGVADTHPRLRVYCPDRPCYFYPSTAGSRARAEDPTVSAWVASMHYLTNVPGTTISRAVGRHPDWAKGMLRAHEKRWRSLPY